MKKKLVLRQKCKDPIHVTFDQKKPADGFGIVCIQDFLEKLR